MSRPADDRRIGINKPREIISATLDELDSQFSKDSANARREERFKYRVRELTVDIADASGTWRSYSCPSRNISANGISLIFGHFVYPGTRCRVTLVSLHNHRATHIGRIVRCRYISGTARLHEVGVQFEAPINVGMFHRGATPTRILVADDDKAMHKLIASLLKEEHVQLVTVEDGKSAADQLQSERFDLALLDINMPEMSGLEVAHAVRSAGVGTPLVAITVNEESSSRPECMKAGFDAWVAKPFTRASLTTVIRSLKCEPIISSMIHDDALIEVIDAFVAGITTRLQQMQEALAAQDWQALSAALIALRVDAGGCGFEIIASAAGELIQYLQVQPERDGVRPRIMQLSRLCHSAMGASCTATAESATH